MNPALVVLVAWVSGLAALLSVWLIVAELHSRRANRRDRDQMWRVVDRLLRGQVRDRW